MRFSKIIPINDNHATEFDSCRNLDEFLAKILSFIDVNSDLRSQQAYLSVYMAFRDHYPSYLKKIDPNVLQRLDHMVEESDPKIIKLRRIALAGLSKVA